jgi:hypothetical protein
VYTNWLVYNPEQVDMSRMHVRAKDKDYTLNPVTLHKLRSMLLRTNPSMREYRAAFAEAMGVESGEADAAPAGTAAAAAGATTVAAPAHTAAAATAEVDGVDDAEADTDHSDAMAMYYDMYGEPDDDFDAHEYASTFFDCDVADADYNAFYGADDV